jgi:two-component system, NarL family, sensor histidine kinase DegS
LDPDAGGLIRTVSPKQSADSPAVESDPRGDLSARIASDVASFDAELAEIDMLVAQARSEAERHELKRSQTAAKIAAMPAGSPAEDVIASNVQLVGLTRRAAVMESQVDSLEGKRRALVRFRDSLMEIAAQVAGTDLTGPMAASGVGGSIRGTEEATPAMSRVILNAQEDLRRDIARAMHDGPAQSLTNIVLQAQIVERLVNRDPEMARGEVRQLIAMVQQTLDATKSFIFEVRPMVLDDLGLVPTLRRAARERGRRAGIAVEFESMGTDRRLTMDLESGLFRIIDEAMAAYLSAAPDRVSVRLDWADDHLEGVVSASRERSHEVDAAEREAESHATRPASGQDLPPALASMMNDRREQAEAAAEAARNAAIVALPPQAWRDIQQRAASVAITAELVADGGELRIAVELALAESA